MTEVLPPAADLRNHALQSVLRHLEESGYPTPPTLYVEDADGSWVRHAARRPVERRRSSVLAATTGAGVVDAIRLQVGGAVWLPASTPAMEAACEAAAAARHRPSVPWAGEDLLELAASSAAELRLVGWVPRQLWRRQLGRRLVDRLSVLAERLRCVPVVLPAPALLVADRSPAEIESAWRESTDNGGVGAPGPPVVQDVAGAVGSTEPAAAVARALAAMAEASARRLRPQPVHELPGGRRVGWWAPELDPEGSPGDGWSAVPREPTPVGHVWQLGTGYGDWETVVDALDLDDDRTASAPLLRVPGWFAADLGRGTPAGLLVERLARDPRRAARPLWVPNVDFEGVQFLLSLPAPIWVDGPGVPGAGS